MFLQILWKSPGTVTQHSQVPQIRGIHRRGSLWQHIHWSLEFCAGQGHQRSLSEVWRWSNFSFSTLSRFLLDPSFHTIDLHCFSEKSMEARMAWCSAVTGTWSWARAGSRTSPIRTFFSPSQPSTVKLFSFTLETRRKIIPSTSLFNLLMDRWINWIDL